MNKNKSTLKNIKRYEAEMMHMVAHMGEGFRKRDSQDRIISIEKTKKGHRILTTENQLAVKIGRKIGNTLKKAEVYISHSDEPHQVSRVSVRF